MLLLSIQKLKNYTKKIASKKYSNEKILSVNTHSHVGKSVPGMRLRHNSYISSFGIAIVSSCNQELTAG